MEMVGLLTRMPSRTHAHQGLRADILTPTGRVIELQSKPAGDIIQAREAAYGPRLRWLFRLRPDQIDRIHWGRTLDNGARGFRWKHGSKLIASCRNATYFDFGDDDLYWARLVTKAHTTEWGTSNRVLGYGRWVTPYDLIDVPVPAIEDVTPPDQLGLWDGDAA